MLGRTAAFVAGLALAGAVSGAAAPQATAPALPDAGRFVERLVVQIVRDDYARAWLTLHPAHKATARRWDYVQCELQSKVPGAVESVRAVRVAEKSFTVAGIGRVRGKAVTFRLVLRGMGTITHTSHVVAVDGRWRWILTPERYELYRADGCGATGPSA